MALASRVAQIIDESLEVEREDAKEAGRLGFMARALVQATLPHSDPRTHFFERTTGLVTLSIVNRPQVGVPYGSIPRILIAWLCTEAVRTQSPELVLGKSQADFLRKLEMSNCGRDIARLKDQAHRLFSSMISLTGQRGVELGLENVVIAKRALLFWNPRRPEERSAWESTLTLTTDFFEEVTSSPVPVDLRVLHALSKSPMAMDIYTWLTYRVFLLRAKGRSEVLVPWEALAAQFGAGYGQHAPVLDDTAAVSERQRKALRNFRGKFQHRLREVLLFYPAARDAVAPELAGLRVRACELHIQEIRKVRPTQQESAD